MNRWEIPENTIVSKKCTICYRTNPYHTHYCTKYHDHCESIDHSGLVTNGNMEDVADHRHCTTTHKRCHEHFDFRDIHLIEHKGRVYKYFKHEHRVSHSSDFFHIVVALVDDLSEWCLTVHSASYCLDTGTSSAGLSVSKVVLSLVEGGFSPPTPISASIPGFKWNSF